MPPLILNFISFAPEVVRRTHQAASENTNSASISWRLAHSSTDPIYNTHHLENILSSIRSQLISGRIMGYIARHFASTLSLNIVVQKCELWRELYASNYLYQDWHSMESEERLLSVKSSNFSFQASHDGSDMDSKKDPTVMPRPIPIASYLPPNHDTPINTFILVKIYNFYSHVCGA
jgi:hypothetical protein